MDRFTAGRHTAGRHTAFFDANVLYPAELRNFIKSRRGPVAPSPKYHPAPFRGISWLPLGEFFQ